MHFNVPRVIGRVNNPSNHWLYSKDWGVDVAVSPMDIITKVIEEEMSLGDLVTLLKLKQGEVALTEIKLTDSASSVGKKVADLSLPTSTLLVTVMRGMEVIFPSGETVLEAGDDVLAITSVEKEEELMRALS
jgi:trk system potassium uptake protein TrkA